MTGWLLLTTLIASVAWFQAYQAWFHRDVVPAPEVGAGTETEDDLARFTRSIARWANPEDAPGRERLRLQMIRAGLPQRHLAEVFAAARVLLALAVPLVVMPPLWDAIPPLTAALLALLLTAIAYYAPGVWLNARGTARRRRLARPLPDALDLLVSSVEAGLGLDPALRRVAIELQTAAPELAGELQRVHTEVSAGIPRLTALRNLAVRTGLDEVQSLVNLLVQSDRFGTAIARSLRVHATTARQHRMSRAEEEAAKVSPKLTVVMILFLLPCLFVVLLGPAILNVRHALGGP
jgi:tight adherence protein C